MTVITCTGAEVEVAEEGRKLANRVLTSRSLQKDWDAFVGRQKGSNSGSVFLRLRLFSKLKQVFPFGSRVNLHS